MRGGGGRYGGRRFPCCSFGAVSSARQIMRAVDLATSTEAMGALPNMWALPAMTAQSVVAKKAAPDTDEIMITSPQGRAAAMAILSRRLANVR